MPPKSTPTKGQQSITGFFTRATVNGLSQPRPSQKQTPQSPPASTSKPTVNDPAADLYNAGTESDDDAVPPPSRFDSAAFKRKSPLVGDAAGENASMEPPAKRAKADDEYTSSTFFADTAIRTTPKKPAPKTKPASIRTDKFLYTGTPSPQVADEDETPASQKQKQKLHAKFVKKLGHPDSISQIKRRHWQNDSETPGLDGEDADAMDEDDEPPPLPKGKKKGAKTGKLTPMEIQFLDIKRKHMDAILIVEVGYKFKFFGEDARVAAKELGIVCIPGKYRFDEHPSEAHLDRFASASIPVHRLPVHAKRLVLAGHKVGVVRQIETAALKKAGDNRNTPFIRKLTNLYTKGTYIDDVDGLEEPTAGAPGGAPASGHLLCITESNLGGNGSDEKVNIGILAVQPGTGDIIYDEFEDGFMRSELETRLLHISPCEFLIVGELSKNTEKLIQHLSSSSTNVFGDRIRVERKQVTKKTISVESYAHIEQFYSQNLKARDTEDERSMNLLEKVLHLPDSVTVCLSQMIKHMSDYGLEHVFDLTKYFQSFGARSNMLLNGNTLTSLEIYHNQTDHAPRGSLFWMLDKTKTKFGQRLLRKWVGRPLIDKDSLEERQDAVTELMQTNQERVTDKLKSLLMKIKSDLERSLIRIYYGKCTRPEVLTVLQTMQRIATEFGEVRSASDVGYKSSLLNNAIALLPVIGDAIVSFLSKINAQAAKDDNKYEFFLESFESEDMLDLKCAIAAVEHDLDQHKAEAAAALKKKHVQYHSVAGIEYLIEVENTHLKLVPASWIKISGTKKVSRFHTPEVVRFIRLRDQHKEALAAAADLAFANFLIEIAGYYQAMRDCVQSLAQLDCLLSIATVAAQPGYTRPEFVTDSNSTEIHITDGRHPMAEQLMLENYVPNSTSLSNASPTTSPRALLITGPNMGGKSTYVRSIALLSILAQIGSYIPAQSAKLSLLDAVYTRMGAEDNMLKGESTFMVELSETSDILKLATKRSLVILDELGRGTSTHDGVAIAQAVLEHVVRDIGCLTLFITHYQTLSTVAKGFPGGELRNVHMQFEETGDDEVVFLYTVGEGMAHRSYGLNVARLANVPKPVIETAKVKSSEMEESEKGKMMRALAGLVGQIAQGTATGDEVDMLARRVEML